jgi:hypothetical protein
MRAYRRFRRSKFAYCVYLTEAERAKFIAEQIKADADEKSITAEIKRRLINPRNDGKMFQQ